MLRLRSPVTLRLERGQLLAWPRQSGVHLRIVAGTAWVTQANDPEDHFLQPGQTMTLRPGSRAIVSAEHDVSLSFEAECLPGPLALWRRWRAARVRRGEALPYGVRTA